MLFYKLINIVATLDNLLMTNKPYNIYSPNSYIFTQYIHPIQNSDVEHLLVDAYDGYIRLVELFAFIEKYPGIIYMSKINSQW